MRKILSILAPAALAACGQSHSADDQSKAGVADPPAATAPHSNAAPGIYVKAAADGSIMTTMMLQSDGTYSTWVAGEQTEIGKWAIKNNETCFMPEKGDERCGSDGPMQPDGRFRVTPDKGDPYTLRKTA